MEQVILVDEDDHEIGTMEKMEAHRTGTLHRAFSVFVFNSRGKILLQKRARSKYHSPGLWTNACCSHPRPNESILDASSRRLREELGIDAKPEFVYKFTYKTVLQRDLIEHEVDHVFKVIYNGSPTINRDEVEDWKFISIEDVRRDVATHPERYTYWFRQILDHRDPRLTIS